MSTIAGMLAEYPPLSELDGRLLERMAVGATLQQFDPGRRLLESGKPADHWYVIRHGRVAIEITSPQGGALVIETLDPGEIVGVSWLLPPHRTTFDARCVQQTGAITIDAAALRQACETDHELGYQLYRAFAGVIRERLQAARLQVLDLYGGQRDA